MNKEVGKVFLNIITYHVYIVKRVKSWWVIEHKKKIIVYGVDFSFLLSLPKVREPMRIVVGRYNMHHISITLRDDFLWGLQMFLEHFLR